MRIPYELNFLLKGLTGSLGFPAILFVAGGRDVSMLAIATVLPWAAVICTFLSVRRTQRQLPGLRYFDGFSYPAVLDDSENNVFATIADSPSTFVVTGAGTFVVPHPMSLDDVDDLYSTLLSQTPKIGEF